MAHTAHNTHACLHLQMHVARKIVAEEGARGLWGGVRARVLFHMPAAAISWGVYESMKKVLAA